jgi:hypothetical protein
MEGRRNIKEGKRDIKEGRMNGRKEGRPALTATRNQRSIDNDPTHWAGRKVGRESKKEGMQEERKESEGGEGEEER